MSRYFLHKFTKQISIFYFDGELNSLKEEYSGKIISLKDEIEKYYKKIKLICKLKEK